MFNGRERFDYSVKDSTHENNAKQYSLLNGQDNTIRIGIIREETEVRDGSTRYIVEVFKDGKQVPLSCVWMTRFGGVHNFEEYRLRPWSRNPAIASNAGPASASTYDLRSGDRVVVAQLGRSGREGIILGGLTHPARGESTDRGSMAYHSSFQGIDTLIEDDGTYTVTYKGKPVNTEIALETPPSGVTVQPPAYNPTTEGSFYQFDNLGSYTVSDGNDQLIKIKKQTGNIVIVSGDRRIEIGNADPLGLLSAGVSVKSDVVKVSADDITVGAKNILLQGTSEAVLSGTKIAIGNSAMELLDTIVKIVDAIGKVTVTSPVGICTPLVSAPQWTEVLLLKTLIEKSKTSIPTPLPVFLV